MRIIGLSVLAACAVACGGNEGDIDDSGSDGAGIRIAGEIEEATREVGVRVFASRDRNDVIVTCTSLLSGNPTDERYELLKSADFTYPLADGATITVGDISAKDGAVVYVVARDSRDAVIGEGCTAGVNVKGGSTTNVQIVVYPAS